MSKLPDPTENPTPEIASLVSEMERVRGIHIDGLYRIMLNHIELTQHVSHLGAFLRFHGELPDEMREAVNLYIAKETKATYEWIKHVQPAKKAGIPEAFIEQMRTGQCKLDDYPRYAPVITAAKHVLNHESLPEGLQNELIEKLGVKALLELVILVGFYGMVGGFLAAFDIPLPEGTTE